MKKLMIAFAVAAIAVTSQAAAIKWTTSGSLQGVGLTGLDGNSTYAADGAAMKNNSSLTYAFTFFTEGTDTEVTTWNGTVSYGTGVNSVSKGGTVSKLAASTTYDYTLVVSGTQADLQALGVKGDWDYSDATVSATVKGQLTTLKSGQTTFVQDIGSWTVSGAVAAPEPTSGLLLLLGVAGLALRRRRA